MQKLRNGVSSSDTRIFDDSLFDLDHNVNKQTNNIVKDDLDDSIVNGLSFYSRQLLTSTWAESTTK